MSPDLLPSITELRCITQSLAMLDAILSPEWEYRCYSFDSAWAPGEEMASMRNGSGDGWFLLLDPAGTDYGAWPASVQGNCTSRVNPSRVLGLKPVF